MMRLLRIDSASRARMMLVLGAFALPLLLSGQSTPPGQIGQTTQGSTASVTKEQAPAGQSTQILTAEEKEEVLQDPSRMRRFYVGVKLGYDVFQSVKDGSVTTQSTDTNPQTYYSSGGTGTHKPGTAGAFVQVRLYHRYFLDVEGLISKAGYNTTATTESVVINGATNVTYVDSGTRFKYIDIPVLIRWYNKGNRTGRYRFFANGGVTARETKSIRSEQQTYVNTANVVYSYIPDVPNATRVLGATVGAGLRATDDFGIKVEPEVRYTRWRSRPFTNAADASRADELQISLSFSY
jgi:hypothetical protein